MNDVKSNPWYVGERGELLAGVFLLDLNPEYLGRAIKQPAAYDYLATFKFSNDRLVTISVEVKATEKPLNDRHILLLPRRQVEAMRSSNIPFLIVVADVIRNIIGFNWATALEDMGGRARMVDYHRFALPLRKPTPEEVGALKAEIEGQQSPAPLRLARRGRAEGEA